MPDSAKPMSSMERVKLWFRTFWAALDAVEEGPYGHMDRQISSLSERVRKLENDHSSSSDRQS